MSRVRSPLMVGREAELASLTAALDRARAGAAGTVIVSGEAGVGKSRLVEEFLRGPVVDVGAIGVVGACLDLGAGGIPYAAFLELLRDLRRTLGAERWAEVVRASGPALAPLIDTGALGVAVLAPLAPHASEDIRRARLFGGVLDLLSGVAEVHPLAIVVEDLHWADLATLELVAFLVRNLRTTRVLTVLTVRSDDVVRDDRMGALLATLERDAGLHRLDLARLSPEDVRRQFEAITQASASDADIADLHGRSGGNPFLAEELIALSASGDAEAIPMAARDILLARLTALSLEAQTLVAAVAVGGPSVGIDTLREVVAGQLGRSALAVVIDEAVRHAVLVRRADHDIVEFRHALAREAALADLLAGDRRRWHERWATALESSATDEAPWRAVEVARHRDGAGQPDEARTWWLKAADFAADRLAFDAAAAAYQRAVDLFRQAAPPGAGEAVPADVLASTAHAMRFAGRSTEAVAIAEAVVDAMAANDHTGRSLALERLGTYRIEVGDNDGAVAATAEAVGLLRDGPPEAFARASLAHAICLVHVVRFDAVPTFLEPVLTLAREHEWPTIEAMALCQRGLVRIHRGDLDGAAEDFARSWQAAIASGDTEAILLIALDRPFLDEARGDFAAGLEHCLEGIAVAERIGAIGSFDALGMMSNAASWLCLLGRWDDAERQLERAEVQDPLGRTRDETLLLRARIRAYRGDLQEARQQLARPRVELGAQMDAYVSIVEGEIALLAGDPAATIDAVGAAMDAAAPIGNLTGLLQRVEAAVLASAAAAAIFERRPDASRRRDVDALIDRLTRAVEAALHAMPPGWTSLEVEAWRHDLDAWRRRLDGHDDHEAWAASADGWSRLSVPYRSAWAMFRQAGSLLDGRGDRAAIERLLRASMATAMALGARPLMTEIEALARRGRIAVAVPGDTVDAARPRRDRRFGLTPREVDVLRLIVDGRSNREIGEALFISPKTAGAHVGNILGKLGVAGRVQAATLALHEGLVEK